MTLVRNGSWWLCTRKGIINLGYCLLLDIVMPKRFKNDRRKP